MNELRARGAVPEVDSRVDRDEEPDLVIVNDDGVRVTVEVKVHGSPHTVYTAPKKTLNVIFTPAGIQRLVEPATTSRIAPDAPAATPRRRWSRSRAPKGAS